MSRTRRHRRRRACVCSTYARDRVTAMFTSGTARWLVVVTGRGRYAWETKSTDSDGFYLVRDGAPTRERLRDVDDGGCGGVERRQTMTHTHTKHTHAPRRDSTDTAGAYLDGDWHYDGTPRSASTAAAAIPTDETPVFPYRRGRVIIMTAPAIMILCTGGARDTPHARRAREIAMVCFFFPSFLFFSIPFLQILIYFPDPSSTAVSSTRKSDVKEYKHKRVREGVLLLRVRTLEPPTKSYV